MKPEELNTSNYHSTEANNIWMGKSQFLSWLKCPAKQYAIMNGAWPSNTSKALLIGSYVDVALLTPLDLPEWYDAHRADMVSEGLLSKAKTTPGKKGVDMVWADAMIEAAKNDPEFLASISGKSQVIFTGEIAGVPWKIMIDSFHLDNLIITDLKTTKSIGADGWFYRDTIIEKMSGTDKQHKFNGLFYDEWRYFLQFGAYRHITAQATGVPKEDWTLLMAAISKEKTKDVNNDIPLWRQVDYELFAVDDEEAMEQEMEFIVEYQPHVIRWKTGQEPAPACGECGFCRAHKKVTCPKSIKSRVLY